MDDSIKGESATVIAVDEADFSEKYQMKVNEAEAIINANADRAIERLGNPARLPTYLIHKLLKQYGQGRHKKGTKPARNADTKRKNKQLMAKASRKVNR